MSSLTYAEAIELRSTLHALSNQDFICSQCQGKYRHRSDAETMLERVKQLKGCETIGPNLLHQVSQGDIHLKYNTCIGNFVSDSAIYWIRSYNHFEKGSMPFPGGYMDQPAKVIDIMSIIGAHKNDEIKKEAQKKQARDRNNMRMTSRGRQ